MSPWDADAIRSEVAKLADAAWAKRIGSGPFRYIDGVHNFFPAKYLEMNGPEALAELAARTLDADPKLRKKWLRAIKPSVERKRDAKGRFKKGESQ